jgi:hypothetical protein
MWAVILVVVLAQAARPAEESLAPPPETTTSRAEPGGQAHGQWSEMRPLEFLAFLQERAKVKGVIGSFYSVSQQQNDWVREEDVPALIELVKSKKPCAHIKGAFSSYAPVKRSFVGQEALLMIEGFRQGVYPPISLMGTSQGFYGRKADILKWWRERGPVEQRDTGDGRRR